jgi:hypothetical protein
LVARFGGMADMSSNGQLNARWGTAHASEDDPE